MNPRRHQYSAHTPTQILTTFSQPLSLSSPFNTLSSTTKECKWSLDMFRKEIYNRHGTWYTTKSNPTLFTGMIFTDQVCIKIWLYNRDSILGVWHDIDGETSKLKLMTAKTDLDQPLFRLPVSGHYLRASDHVAIGAAGKQVRKQFHHMVPGRPMWAWYYCSDSTPNWACYTRGAKINPHLYQLPPKPKRFKLKHFTARRWNPNLFYACQHQVKYVNGRSRSPFHFARFWSLLLLKIGMGWQEIKMDEMMGK